METCEPRRLLAGAAQLVAQVDSTTLGSNAGPYLEMNGVAYFPASTPATGYELWRSDGTAAGTWQVKDLTPLTSGSTFDQFLVAGNTLYFLRDRGGTTELWRSDGTTAGTTVIGSLPVVESGPMTMVGGMIYFAARDFSSPNVGRELYCSDGTAAGTRLLKDINPDSANSNPQNFIVYHGTVYFVATDNVRYEQIWTTDGTAAGTVPVTNINTGAGRFGFGANNFTLYHDAIYFAGSDDNQTTYHIWKTDGTAAGTTRVIVTNAGPDGSRPYNFTVSGNQLFFTAEDPTAGYELFVSDGTQAGTHLVKDIAAGSYDSTEVYFADNDGVLYFSVNATYYLTKGVWRTDGTDAGTYRVSGDVYFDATSDFAVVNGKVYCLVEDTDKVPSVRQLAVFDENPADARVLTNTVDLRNNPLGPARIGDSVFFTQFTAPYGAEPWRTDGTTAGTVLIKDINTAPPPDGSAPQLLRPSGPYVYFSANVPSLTGRELYRTDGTAAGTILLADAVPGTGSGSPTSLTDVGGTLYFVAGTASGISRLWRSDGTAAGTAVVSTALSNPSNLLNVDGVLYFTAQASSGYGLYKQDAGGPVLVSALAGATPNASALGGMIRFNGALYFRGSTAAAGLELWKYVLDGSGGAAAMVKDILAGSGSSSPDKFTIVGSTFFFAAATTAAGTELWKTDGTAAGTVMVADINPGSATSTPSFLIPFNGYLLFSATTAAAGSELWRSDGTAAGTFMITDIAPGSLPAIVRNITDMGGFALLEANNANLLNNELWRTDGTAAGTYMVREINPRNTADPQQFINVGGRLYFRANDGTVGAELWTSDGTRGGTVLVNDLLPGSGSSTPQNFAALGGNVFFAAAGPTFGQELWMIPDSPAYVAARGELIVSGTSGADHFSLSAGASDLTVQRDGSSAMSFPLSSFSSVVVSGLGGDDVLDVNSSLAAPLTFDGNEGHNAVNFNGGSNVVAADVGAGSTLPDVHVAVGAGVTFNASQHLASLSVDGTATLVAGGGKILALRDLAVGAAGVLRLNDNALALHYSGASPLGTWDGSAYTGVTGLIARGRNGGAWDGSGIVTSTAGANDYTTLAAAEASDVLGITAGQTGTWAGETVDATTVLVKFTYAGDANLDGMINIDDYTQIDSSVSAGGAIKGWYNGDFNYDGEVNIDDYTVIDSNINVQGAPL